VKQAVAMLTEAALSWRGADSHAVRYLQTLAASRENPR
jgi:hypothetical protein